MLNPKKISNLIATTITCHCERSVAIACFTERNCTVRDCFVVPPRNDSLVR
jgi:hypothetical protein